MRAAFVEWPGPAEGIRYGELPDPACGPRDVLVRVEAVAVNHVDTYIRAGSYRTPVPFPFVVGRDLVGVVERVGDEVTGFRRGQRVWSNSMGHAGRQGVTSTLASVPQDRLYPLPDGADPVEAVAALHPAATAYTALVHHGGLRAGATVFVNGGNGSLGACLIQTATALGARVIAAARGPGKVRRCRELGAWAAIDTGDGGAGRLGARLRELAPAGVDLYCDTTGRLRLDGAVAALADRGRLLVVAASPAAADQRINLRDLYVHDRRVVGLVISLATVDELADAARWINQRLARGGFGVEIAEVRPLSAARQAHLDLEAAMRGERRHPPGRLVLRP